MLLGSSCNCDKGCEERYELKFISEVKFNSGFNLTVIGQLCPNPSPNIRLGLYDNSSNLLGELINFDSPYSEIKNGFCVNLSSLEYASNVRLLHESISFIGKLATLSFSEFSWWELLSVDCVRLELDPKPVNIEYRECEPLIIT